MRVVIYASIDPRLVEAFADQQAQTLFDLGSQDVKDHVLVKRLECDVLVTADRGFEHEHDLKSLSFGIIILHVARNKIVFYRPLFVPLLQAVATMGLARWFMFTVLPPRNRFSLRSGGCRKWPQGIPKTVAVSAAPPMMVGALSHPRQ